MHFDLTVFHYLNGLAGQSLFGDAMGILAANYLPWLLVVWLAVLWFWPRRQRLQHRAMAFVAVVSGLVARFVVKSLIIFIYPRPRPFMVLANVHKLISTTPLENFQSFPSGHTIFFFAVAMGIYLFNRTFGVISFILVTIMGVARVFVGVHWPSDIIWGAALGILTAWTIWKFMYQRYKHVFHAWLIRRKGS